MLRVIGDANGRDVAFGLHPLMFFCVTELRWIGHGRNPFRITCKLFLRVLAKIFIKTMLPAPPLCARVYKKAWTPRALSRVAREPPQKLSFPQRTAPAEHMPARYFCPTSAKAIRW